MAKLDGTLWQRALGRDARSRRVQAPGGPSNVDEMLALIHSEISEALEGRGRGLMDDHLPHRRMVEVELADAMIPIADLAGYLDVDLGGP